MRVRKYAAIDIGSNAVRLLISNVLEYEDQEARFKKSALVRVPVRLGEDAFTQGEISKRNAERIVKTMQSFKLLMEVHGVERYMACATSALREASNGDSLVRRVEEEADIKISVIDGQREAAIIAATDLRELLRESKTYLYVDVGGGSTEFTVYAKGAVVTSQSFKIGTVRLLNNMVPDSAWEELKMWIHQNTKESQKISIIGSGGNINKLHKMSGRKMGQPLSYVWLNAQYRFLDSMGYEHRLSELGLNPDRADVIIPATRIFLSAAKWSGAQKIHVPKIGLSDGIIKALYYSAEEGIKP